MTTRIHQPPALRDRGLMARIDLNLVLQAFIAAVLLWAVREVMDVRDTSLITQVEVRANTAAIERVTLVLDRLSVMQERLARVEAMLDRYEGAKR